MAQFQHNLGVGFDSGQTPSSSASHMDAANQQSQQQDTGLPGFQWIVDETRPAVSFPSRNHTQSSSTGSRSESSPTPASEQQIPAQDSREMKNIDVDFRMDDLGMNFGLNMASVTNNSSSSTVYNDSRGTMEFENTPADDEFSALTDDLHPSQVLPSAPHQQPYSLGTLSLVAGLASNPNLSLSSSVNYRSLSPSMGHFRRASSGARSDHGAELWGRREHLHPLRVGQ